MRILTFTTLFPNASQPDHGIFVENRLRHLLGSGQASGLVVAPVPWFPSMHPRFGAYARFAAVPRVETRAGLAVHHPRFPAIPKLGMAVAPGLLYAATRPYVARLLAGVGDVDLIDAHYFYPDGVAAILLGRQLGKPVVITARGTDVNLIPRHSLPRRQIRWAAQHASGLVTVCQALKDALVDLGVEESRVRVLRNGVDLDLFRPADRAAIRGRMGLAGQVLLSVGQLIPRKGQDLVIRALASLPAATLLLAGDGPLRQSLERLAGELGVAARVRFLGQVAHQDLSQVYAAADALVLASSREGWANVLLEAMACGTPAVATPVWGNAEVVAEPAAGVVAGDRTVPALVAAIERLFAMPPAREATRAYAERFGWGATTEGQLQLFRSILGPVEPSPLAGETPCIERIYAPPGMKTAPASPPPNPPPSRGRAFFTPPLDGEGSGEG